MMSDPYEKLATYLLSSTLASPPTSEALQVHINAIRTTVVPKPGVLSTIWPGILQVLAYPILTNEIITLLVDEVVEPIIASGASTWEEIRTTVGDAETLLETSKADTNSKVKKAAIGFLSFYDFSDGEQKGLEIVQEIVGIITIENQPEGVITRVENIIDQFLTNYFAVRPTVIRSVLEIKKAGKYSATIISRVQELTLTILRHNTTGVDDIPADLLNYTVTQDDILAELMTIQFYESLLDLYLPPTIFFITKPTYLEIANTCKSSAATNLERSAASRTLGRLSRSREDVFSEIDSSLGIVKNLTLRDEIDRTMLALIPGKYIATVNPQLIRNFPVSAASLVDILLNWCHSKEALDLLRLDTPKLTKLPVPELLRVGKALAESYHGKKVLVSLPGVMEVLLTRRERMGYRIMRLRGDIVDTLAESDSETLGLYWYDRVQEERVRGHWGREENGEPKVDIMDRAA
ncbi:hypothetical protein V1508DRAFT_427420 [Lipomyces doorenjongii]|uniref:uncharacterized protein n=1 Tax=Lipomyces doorenjongii TaxID=383834 RepID=UPI0034CE62F7